MAACNYVHKYIYNSKSLTGVGITLKEGNKQGHPVDKETKGNLTNPTDDVHFLYLHSFAKREY